MQKNEVIFIINDQERIKLFLPCELNDISRDEDVNAVYVRDGFREQIIYQNDCIFEFVDVLNSCLKLALSGNSKIDASLQANLGYMCNVYLYGNGNASISIEQDKSDLRGKHIKLWEVDDATSWLYEKDDKFYFEITPAYKWYYQCPTPEERAEYVTYKQFLKNYKIYPVAVVELGLETMYRWLEQTNNLLALITLSDEKHGILTPEILKLSEMWVEMQKKKEE